MAESVLWANDRSLEFVTYMCESIKILWQRTQLAREDKKSESS